jgi:hypothetical protein
MLLGLADFHVFAVRGHENVHVTVCHQCAPMHSVRASMWWGNDDRSYPTRLKDAPYGPWIAASLRSSQ